MSPSSNPYRLARSAVPSAYRVFLTPDLEAFTFSGRVEIDVDIHESVSTLTLNAVDLELRFNRLAVCHLVCRCSGGRGLDG